MQQSVPVSEWQLEPNSSATHCHTVPVMQDHMRVPWVCATCVGRHPTSQHRVVVHLTEQKDATTLVRIVAMLVQIVAMHRHLLLAHTAVCKVAISNM